MNLKDLKKEIPYQWREGSGGTQLAYIDARQVMDLLDEVVGPENWQCDYKDIGGKVYCGIGILHTFVLPKDKGVIVDEPVWVWKWDMGVESNFEAEKGEASDAFKRAAVKWGVGRFLYSIAPKKGNKNPLDMGSPGLNDGYGDTSKCDKCGADRVLNPKTGKWFCSAKCWTK